jgi:hypothetical protein
VAKRQQIRDESRQQRKRADPRSKH